MAKRNYEEKIHQIEIKQATMQGDISHIRSRIDEGIGKTVTEIYKKMDEILLIGATVNEHKFWIGLVKKVVVVFVLAGILGGSTIGTINLLK